ncbi:hypothetical protein L249_6456, partial [Ophiocordyceps polyrhachis-furcata BCC 54312]
PARLAVAATVCLFPPLFFPDGTNLLSPRLPTSSRSFCPVNRFLSPTADSESIQEKPLHSHSFLAVREKEHTNHGRRKIYPSFATAIPDLRSDFRDFFSSPALLATVGRLAADSHKHGCTYPQQTTMLQARPSSTSGIVPPSPSHANHPYMGPGSPQSPRSPYHGAASSAYRGNAAAVQPYAFTSTPNLHQTVPRQHYSAYRAGSSSGAPGTTPPHDVASSHRNSPQLPPAGYSLSFGVGHGGSRDDSVLTTRTASPTPRSPSTLSVGSQPSSNSGAVIRNAPERYRRSGGGGFHARSQSSTLPSSIAVLHPSQPYPVQSNPRYSAPAPPGHRGLVSVSSLDDIHLRGRQHLEDARKLHRRSLHGIDASDKFGPMATDAARSDADPKSPRLVPSAVTHSRSVSSESVASTRSSQSRRSATNRSVSDSKGTPSSPVNDEASPKTDQPRLVNIPPRGSSSDATKRTLSPSPLSKPATMATTEDEATAVKLDSPAAKQLAAINQKGGKTKSKASRLRRAFSFGSAADFRKAAGGDDDGAEKEESAAKLHKEPTPEEAYDAEQARIAEAQEAAGIGSSIYGGRFFGSTDNISISSTASSASVMIRKMGRGMKKGTRSLVGLFRPKSVTGIPPPDAPPSESSQAAVSMITVEAEAQRVNVTADPAQANGGTGFPHLERNSLDAARISDMAPERLDSSGRDQAAARKSIVGGDKERAEALAAVRKGILKRERSLGRIVAAATTDRQPAAGSASPSARPAESSPELALPNILGVADSPNSTAPSTPNDESQGHKRTGSISIGNEDYFVSALRLRQETRSPPATPQGAAKRSATFSPRIVFYDTWPSQEYDRRGNIATCNRLTPMLAQQIKEELNTFKMLHGRAFYESIGSPKFVVAPMVDQSEFAWRMLTRSLMPEAERGRLLAYTPMLHARLFATDDKYRRTHFQPTTRRDKDKEEEAWLDGNAALGDRPLFVQFCANEPDTLLKAAKLVAPYCDAVDLNLGCPQGIARKGRYGAFLQEDQDLIFRLIDKLHRELDVPVTAKIRILDDREETLAYARNVLSAGASILTVHGRTRQQKSHLTGVADWDTLRFLREKLPPETVIFANGNILQPGDVERCLSETGADAVMSAEGNLSDPAIFANGVVASDVDARREYWYGLKDGHGEGWRVDAIMRRYLDILHVYALGSSTPPRPRAPKAFRASGSSDMQVYEAVLREVETKVAQGIAEYAGSGGSSFDHDLALLFPPPASSSSMHADEEASSSAPTLRRCRRPWWVAQPIVRPLPAEALEKGAVTFKKEKRKKKDAQKGDES